MYSRTRLAWHFIAICPWVSYLTSLRICFLLSKMGIKIPVSLRVLEELNEAEHTKHKKFDWQIDRHHIFK